MTNEPIGPRLTLLFSVALTASTLPLACLTPPPGASEAPAGAPGSDESPSHEGTTPSSTGEKGGGLDAWAAARQMGRGINIGNTLENTTAWETGWGNPPITRRFVEAIHDLGFQTVRVPVAWDTYAVDGKIQKDKLERVGEVVDLILELGMFAVVNIHWDGGWIDSGKKEAYPDTYATFSSQAQQKYPAYWQQIATFFEGRSEKLLFEALNEETNFENEGSLEKAYSTLTRVNQLFVDTVRGTGGNNATRLLVVTGYHTDIKKTCAQQYRLPVDSVPDRLFISVHYYTPWQFCGMTEDADWGKMMPTWGTPKDFAELDELFDTMAEFSSKNDIPVFLGEYGASHEKEAASRIRWTSAVSRAALSRKMVPVLWDTGHDIARHAPHAPSKVLSAVLSNLSQPSETEPVSPRAAPGP